MQYLLSLFCSWEDVLSGAPYWVIAAQSWYIRKAGDSWSEVIDGFIEMSLWVVHVCVRALQREGSWKMTHFNWASLFPPQTNFVQMSNLG